MTVDSIDLTVDSKDLNEKLFDMAVKRLESFGFIPDNNDKFMLEWNVKKKIDTVKNECNVYEIPEGLIRITVDMAVGEFLLFISTSSPEKIRWINFDAAVKQIQVGDTNTTFAVGDGSGTTTPEQRLHSLINYLTSYGRSEFNCYRRIKW